MSDYLVIDVNVLFILFILVSIYNTTNSLNIHRPKCYLADENKIK